MSDPSKSDSSRDKWEGKECTHVSFIMEAGDHEHEFPGIIDANGMLWAGPFGMYRITHVHSTLLGRIRR